MSALLATLEFLGVEFDFDTIDAVGAGTFLLAVATTVLAIFTWRLAKAANDGRRTATEQVRTAQRQLEVAQKTLDAEYRPIVVEVPEEPGTEQIKFRRRGDPVGVPARTAFVHADDSVFLCSVAVRNIGRGMAQLETAWLTITSAPGIGFHADDLTRVNMASGDVGRLNFQSDAPSDDFAALGAAASQGETIEVHVRYADVGKRQVTTTTLDLVPASRGSTWDVKYVNVGEPDTGELPPPGAYPPDLPPARRRLGNGGGGAASGAPASGVDPG